MGASTAIAGGSAVLGAGQGIYSMIKANKQRKEAQAAIDNFRSQELTNAYKDVQVSTLGSDLIKEQADTAVASTIDALQKGGSRTLAAGAGNVVANQVRTNQQAAADLDRQQKEINMQAAAEDQNIQRMKEDRERAALAGLGTQLDVANQNFQQGFGTVVDSSMMAGQTLGKLQATSERDKLLSQRGYDWGNKTTTDEELTNTSKPLGQGMFGWLKRK